MAIRNIKSEHRNVHGKLFGLSGKVEWVGRVMGRKKHFETEREAAIWVDRVLIRLGKPPRNILKKVDKSEIKEKVEKVNMLVESGRGVYDSCEELGISKSSYYRMK